MSVRTSTALLGRWMADLIVEAVIASERPNVHEASVYHDGALFKIASIRGELNELEAELKAQAASVKCVGRAAA